MDRVYTLKNYTRQPPHITYLTSHNVPNITTTTTMTPITTTTTTIITIRYHISDQFFQSYGKTSDII